MLLFAVSRKNNKKTMAATSEENRCCWTDCFLLAVPHLLEEESRLVSSINDVLVPGTLGEVSRVHLILEVFTTPKFLT